MGAQGLISAVHIIRFFYFEKLKIMITTMFMIKNKIPLKHENAKPAYGWDCPIIAVLLFVRENMFLKARIFLSICYASVFKSTENIQIELNAIFLTKCKWKCHNASSRRYPFCDFTNIEMPVI